VTIRNTASRGIAAGRIQDEKGKIDLYVWIDADHVAAPDWLGPRSTNEDNCIPFTVTVSCRLCEIRTRHDAGRQLFQRLFEGRSGP